MKHFNYNSIIILISITLFICFTANEKLCTTKNKNLDNTTSRSSEDIEDNRKVSQVVEISDNYSNEEVSEARINRKNNMSNSGSMGNPSVDSKNNNQKKIISPKSYKLQIKKNKLFNHTDKELLSELTKYEKCKLKQGVINFVKSVDKTKLLLTVTPIFCVINKDTISLYENESPKTLFNSIKLENVSFLTQRYTGSDCFDVITSEINEKKTALHRNKLSLCGKDYKEWMEAIQIFKECDLSGKGKIVEHPNKLVMDFTRVNQIIHKSSNDLKPLYYDNSCKNQQKNGTEKVEMKETKNQINKILDTIKQGKIAEQQVKREYNSKLNQLKKETEAIEREKEIIKDKIKKKELQETNQSNKTKFKKQELLDAVNHELKSIQKNQINQIKKHLEKEINQEKQKAVIQAQNVEKLIKEKDKLTDYSSCVSKELGYLSNSDYINQVCRTNFGQYGESTCQMNFCSKCCNLKIGVNHVDDRIKCKNQCNKLISLKMVNTDNTHNKNNFNLDKESRKSHNNRKREKGRRSEHSRRNRNNKKHKKYEEPNNGDNEISDNA